MKLSLKIRGKQQRIEVEAKPFTIRVKEGLLSVTTPMHDDWLQTVDFDLRNANVVIEASADWTLVFPDATTFARFQEWLTAANAKAEHGYKSMYP